MDCVPQKLDDGSYPVPSTDKLVWNERWF